MNRAVRLLLAAAAASVLVPPPARAAVRAVPVVSGLSSPVLVTAPAGDFDRLFVVQQGGRVRLLKGGVLLGTPFLDLSSRVSTGGERGLLGLAFHPDYLRNGRFFVSYTNPQGNSVVSELRVSSFSPDVADATSERVLLTQQQPYANHNGGNLVFSPADGFLYVGLGDGGSSGDPDNRAQSDATWLGKLLRLDVDGVSPGKAYAVPPDNPFAGAGGLPLPEIWAKGLRNPWRFSFDRRTSDLYLGDVGQDLWEEVDFQPGGAPGGANYGWRLMEGLHCYNPPSGCAPGSLLTLPILEYPHGGSPARCSVTGGFVVRSPRLPEWAGRYLFADYCSGEVWSLVQRDGAAVEARSEVAELTGGGTTLGNVTSFGEDARGDVYVASATGGAVYRLQTDTPVQARLVPIVLDAPGKGGSRYATELTLLNRGTTTSSLRLTYTPSPALGGTGGGTVPQVLDPGVQLAIPDALEYLRNKGLQIPAGDAAQGGTLWVAFTELSSPAVTHVEARTTTASGPGRAGLAYQAPVAAELMNGPAYLFGLRETDADRTNLALVNGGAAGTIGLRVTLRARGFSKVLPTVVLGPGEWRQLDSVLAGTAVRNAYALVERVAGAAPYAAYAVINDNVTNDGSYVPASLTVRPAEPQVIPAVVETTGFESEVVLANPGASAVTATLVYVESRSASAGSRFATTERLEAGEQVVLPGFVDLLRRRGADIGGRGGAYAGTVTVAFRDASTGQERWGFAGARTTSPAEGGGAYGLFTPALGLSETAFREAWLPGLRQDASVRTNLALANVALDGGPVTLRVELHDAATGLLIATSDPVELGPGRWLQVDRVLRPLGLRAAYARVYRVSGNDRWLAYAVVNDGAAPGEGTGDGSFLGMEAVE